MSTEAFDVFIAIIKKPDIPNVYLRDMRSGLDFTAKSIKRENVARLKADNVTPRRT
jgi:hypothetical protein